MKSLDDVPESEQAELLREANGGEREGGGPPRFPQPEDWGFVDRVPTSTEDGSTLTTIMAGFDLVDGFIDTLVQRGRPILRLGHFDGNSCPRCDAKMVDSPKFDNVCPACNWMSGERMADEAMYIVKNVCQAGARLSNAANNWGVTRRWVEKKTAPLPPGVSKKDLKRFEKVYKSWRKDIADRYLKPALDAKPVDTDLIGEVFDTTYIWAQAEAGMNPEEAEKFMEVAGDRYGERLAAWKDPIHNVLARERYTKASVRPTPAEREREKKLSRFSSSK